MAEGSTDDIIKAFMDIYQSKEGQDSFPQSGVIPIVEQNMVTSDLGI